MSVEFSIISMRETISLTDSKHVKRSKLLYTGLKPKDGFEGAIVSVFLDIAKKDFFRSLDSYEAKDIFDKKKSKEIVEIRNHIFGEKSKLEDFINLDAITIEYFYENSPQVQEEFAHFLSEDLNRREYTKLPQALKLDIFTKLYKNNHKKTYDLFLKYMFKHEQNFIEDYLTGSNDFPKIRNTIKTRELASLRLFIGMVTVPKKEILVDDFLKILDRFEEQMFLDNVDIDIVDLKEDLEAYFV